MNTSNPLDLARLRRMAKTLLKEADAGLPEAVARLSPALKDDSAAPKLADALHVVAREATFSSWPALKTAVDLHGLDRAARVQALKIALMQGQSRRVAEILDADPGIIRADFGIALATYDLAAVTDAIRADAQVATRALGPRSPLITLCMSQHLQAAPEKETQMLRIADLLLEHGSDVNAAMMDEDGQHPLSPLYFALCHARNLPLARWLLSRGASPDDNESLYHATENRDLAGLRLLLDHGATVDGTNALLRAIDFDDTEAVTLLIAAGGSVNGGFDLRDDGPAMTALTHAARRLCGGKMAKLLLEAGADPTIRYQGLSAYEMARLAGLDEMAAVLEQHGAATPIADGLAPILAAIEGRDGPPINADDLHELARSLLHDLVWKGDSQDKIERLVARGMPCDAPDWQGMTPLHVAAWHGNAEAMAFFLNQKPDLGHVNGYGGTLFSTILHGAENAPNVKWTNHLECLRLGLYVGIAIPRRALTAPIREDLLDFLKAWAAERPGSVVEHGVV